MAFTTLPLIVAWLLKTWSEHDEDGWASHVHCYYSLDTEHPCQLVASLVAFSSLLNVEPPFLEQLEAFRLPEWRSSTNDFRSCPSTCNSLQSVITYFYTLLPNKLPVKDTLPVWEQGPDPCVCFRNQRGKKIGDLGDLAGPCQSHMYPLEDEKRTLTQ